MESPCLSQWGCPPAARTDGTVGVWFKYRAMELGVGGDGQSSGQFRGFAEMATYDSLFGLFFPNVAYKTTYFNIPYTRTHLLPSGKRPAKPEFGWHVLQEDLPLTKEEKPMFCMPQWGVPKWASQEAPSVPTHWGPLPTHLTMMPWETWESSYFRETEQHQSPGANSAPQWVDYLLCQIHSNRSMSCMGKHLCCIRTMLI